MFLQSLFLRKNKKGEPVKTGFCPKCKGILFAFEKMCPDCLTANPNYKIKEEHS